RFEVIRLRAFRCVRGQITFRDARRETKLRIFARARLKELRSANKTTFVKREIDEAYRVRGICKHRQWLDLFKASCGCLHGDDDVSSVRDRLRQYLICGLIFYR